MRRALLTAALGGILLTGAGCSDGGDTEDGAAPAQVVASSAPAASPAPDYSANTKKICDSLDKIFDTELEDFGTEIGKMIAYKEAKQADNAEKAEKAAAKQLRDVGARVRKETTVAQDPELKAAGAASATKFTKSAADAKFFDRIKSTKDLDRILETEMTNWLTPVAGYCA
ncbi:hypothetical protein AB0368_32845 [Actinoplanes sp. NPDC051475]|uniref:hypothetical protein n=1 Tax=Actinoplanes sp. NPDC051475 TaxID=3157225 RepID=UPI00344DF479